MCQKEEASESFIPAVVLHPAYISTFCLCSDVTSHPTLVTQTQLPKVIFIKAFQCVGRGRRSGSEMLSFLFACILLGFLLEEKRKYQEYRRKEKLPRQYQEQGSTMAESHPRKIKETFKQKVQFHLFILSKRWQVVKQ